MADLYSNRSSDAYRLASSKTVVNPASATYNLIKIPRYAFVTDVWAEVVTLDASSVTTLGWIGNSTTASADGFMDATVFDDDGAGVKRATAFLGKYFADGSGALTAAVTYGGGTLVFRVYIQFTVMHP